MKTTLSILIALAVLTACAAGPIKGDAVPEKQTPGVEQSEKQTITLEQQQVILDYKKANRDLRNSDIHKKYISSPEFIAFTDSLEKLGEAGFYVSGRKIHQKKVK